MKNLKKKLFVVSAVKTLVFTPLLVYPFGGCSFAERGVDFVDRGIKKLKNYISDFDDRRQDFIYRTPMLRNKCYKKNFENQD